jgi:hypothetical protein
VVAGFRYGLLGNGVGPQPLMAASFAGVLVALVLGAYIFRRAERTIVDLQ